MYWERGSQINDLSLRNERRNETQNNQKELKMVRSESVMKEAISQQSLSILKG